MKEKDKAIINWKKKTFLPLVFQIISVLVIIALFFLLSINLWIY